MAEGVHLLRPTPAVTGLCASCATLADGVALPQFLPQSARRDHQCQRINLQLSGCQRVSKHAALVTGGQVVAGSNPVSPTQVRGHFRGSTPYPRGVSAPPKCANRTLRQWLSDTRSPSTSSWLRSRHIRRGHLHQSRPSQSQLGGHPLIKRPRSEVSDFPIGRVKGVVTTCWLRHP
jgi:hypothetical protein